MRASDYIVEYLIGKGIKDAFGYPGGMVTQLMDSFAKYNNQISAHVTYHEQSAAFAACGYAQISRKPGVAYATSGPGATNLITGICNAYFDSIPTIFITGQVNSNEAKGEYGVRQRGFQETDIVSIVKPVTKYAVYVKNAKELPYELEKSYQMATSGRKGPVLIDIAMNVFREEVDNVDLPVFVNKYKYQTIDNIVEVLQKEMEQASSPIFLIGAGVKAIGCEDLIRKEIARLGVPAVSSMIAFDVLSGNPHYFGFIGAYGTRTANFLVAKSDLIIVIGSRMDVRQVGINRKNFAPDAKIIRFDVDAGELEYKVHEDEVQFCINMETTAKVLKNVSVRKDYSSWLLVCDEIKDLLNNMDANHVVRLIKRISEEIPEKSVITTDVGQNQIWVAQSFKVKSEQRILFSGGHGAMGYSLPAAIGAYYASDRKPVYCITGDGGMQMNIQELQFIAREHLPIKIIVLNNNALGMIRHFQEMYFEGRYFQTKPEGGYTAPNFSKIAEAYGIRSRRVEITELGKDEWLEGPELLEIMIRENTYVMPKLEFGKPNQEQEPLLDRKLYEKIMAMKIDYTKSVKGILDK